MAKPTHHDESDPMTVGVFSGRSLFLWCVLLSVAVVVVYVVPAWRIDRALVLPLDDVYIHFQYATQIAAGELYVYNPGLPPSSGATSLLYPYLLVVGRWLGLAGLSLGYWALSLGLVSLLASCWALALLARSAGLGQVAAGALVTAFAVTGPVGWHYASGMETGLLIALMLWAFYGFVTRRFWLIIWMAAWMAITRPEGSIMAVIAAGGVLMVYLPSRRWRALWAVLPVAALGVQPLINTWVTGSATAAGSSAKSILSMVPPDRTTMFTQILNNFTRMWWEFFTGYSLREGLYLPVGLLALAVAGLAVMLWQQRRYWVVLVAFGWLLAGTAAVSTLDPAFWHFKRYQMPFMALLFPLAGWALAVMPVRVRWGSLAVLVLSAFVSSTVYFAPAYQINVGYLKAQQIPMARWLQANTPKDAIVAVHDVGLIRYLGNRTTVDMVGLTTPGAAASWRNGPGALAEFLMSYEPRPDYVASYTDALGLSYLADTGLYGELLAEFPVVPSDRYNVALAGAYQGVWAVDWSHVGAAADARFNYYADYTSDAQRVASVDVGDLASETSHDYFWENTERRAGFPTEVYEFGYPNGQLVLDGGRLINGAESFKLDTIPGEPLLLITRVHPRYAGEITLLVGEGTYTRSIPEIPGTWVDIATLVAGEHITEKTRITIIPSVAGGFYMPYYHTAYQGQFPDDSPPDDPLASYNTFALVSASLVQRATELQVELAWYKRDARLAGDYRVFVHVYGDPDAAPLAQTDRYPVNGALPPGNWLPGELSDTIMIDLQGLPPGEYTVAVGLYDPNTGERLAPAAEGRVMGDGRLLLDVIEVE